MQIGSAIRFRRAIKTASVPPPAARFLLTDGLKVDMLKHMRTTINLPDDLILQAKKAALDADTTLTEVIANALREALQKGRRKAPRRKIKLTTYGEGGTFPGVDVDDTSALLDLMDGIHDPHRR
jgi:hypothetical protein